MRALNPVLRNAKCLPLIHSRTYANLQSGIYITSSQDIYRNLALEDWIYENVDLQNKSLLLMWRNHPAVVIGRHQNTWAEVNVKAARAAQVPVVRRKSGGGTVYHDLGNINMSFFSTKRAYNRKPNLELLADVLRRHWDLDVKVTERDDIVLQNRFKISGTAAKLGVRSAYHHFTLLLNVDTSVLHKLLNTNLKGIQTKATSSVRAVVRNLQEIDPGVTYDAILDHMTQAYASEFLQSPQMKAVHLDPNDEKAFPGISKIVEELKSWEWTFAKTPKFEVKQGFIQYVEGVGFRDIDISLEVNKGLISDVELNSKSLLKRNELESYFKNILRDTKFDIDIVSAKLNSAHVGGTDVSDIEKHWVHGLLLRHMIGFS